jgi:pyruvate kinase
LTNLTAIADKSDAILIDRGDLSREVPIEQIPAIQKMIIRKAQAHGAKVYVATNLLESMTSAPTPTRAEVNDVYNTLADGADGLVLAAETAIGQYPVGCARMVVRIVQQFQRKATGCGRAIRVRPSSLLAEVEPHGGRLICRTLEPGEDLDINDLPAITADDEELTDVEQIARGAFSPLRGFMDKE